MGQDRESEEKRRRGIRASPAKLRRALAEAGLRTQYALAERIAELEDLEAPPRGLVNRAFRGDAVDPQSLERVARALGVPAWSLYRSSDEPPAADAGIEDGPDGALGDAPAAPQGVEAEGAVAERLPEPTELPEADVAPPVAARRFRVPGGVAAVLGIGLALALAVAAYHGVRAPSPRAGASSVPDRPSAVVLPVNGARGADIHSVLQQELEAHWRVLPAMGRAAAAPPDAQQLLVDAGVERAVEMRVIESGRWLGLVAYVHRRGTMQEAWTGAIRRDVAASRLASVLAGAARSLAADEPAPLGRAGLERYLSARRHLDAANVELNVRRALTDFASAIRADPRFADAYAGLCEALVMDNVRTGDAARLVEAAQECERALVLDARNLEARRASAYLARRRGDLAAAATGFGAVLQEDPGNVDALLGVTEVHLTRYARGEDDQGIELARQAVAQAEQLAPAFWKPPFTHARVLFAAGRVAEAIDAQERAVALDPNVLALSNLGSYRFCAGDFAAARLAYERARAASPEAFVGEAQLAVVEYFLGDYAAAARRLHDAIDLHARSGKAGEHRLWGNYADALRRAGRSADAIDAYAEAIRLADRDAAQGDRNPVHESHLAFYREMLAELDAPGWRGRRTPAAELQRLATANDPVSLTYVAAVLRRRGDVPRAREVLERATASCPGYGESPDLKPEPVAGGEQVRASG